jgi:hypothetical protein
MNPVVMTIAEIDRGGRYDAARRWPLSGHVCAAGLARWSSRASSKGGACVSTVTIACNRCCSLWDPSKVRLIAVRPLLRPAPTILTVLTQFSTFVHTLIILVPSRPSRQMISISSVRKNVCGTLASACELFAQATTGWIGSLIFLTFLASFCQIQPIIVI